MKTTNCATHLEKKHKKLFEEYRPKKEAYQEKQDKKRGKLSSATISKDQTLHQVFASSQPYSKDSSRYTRITDSLAMFIGTNSVAIRIVETPAFKDFVAKLDPRYHLPSRREVSDHIKTLASRLRSTVQSKFSESGKITICADIWSRPGLSESFLGISAHFYSRISHKRFNVLLALAEFPSPHTADRVKVVLDEILQMWGIHEEKVLRFVTDNGSNMVKALRDEAWIFKLRADCINNDDFDAIDEFGLEIEDDESTDDNDPVEDLKFPKHMRCFAHSLMRVLANTADKDKDFIDFRKTIFKTVKAVCRSTRLQERLKQLGDLKLVLPAKTRWNSTYFVFERILKLSEAMDQLAREGLGSITVDEFENVLRISSPIRKAH